MLNARLTQASFLTLNRIMHVLYSNTARVFFRPLGYELQGALVRGKLILQF